MRFGDRKPTTEARRRRELQQKKAGRGGPRKNPKFTGNQHVAAGSQQQKKARGGRPRKRRKFWGNQHVTAPVEEALAGSQQQTKARGGRPRKRRKFWGNQHVTAPVEEELQARGNADARREDAFADNGSTVDETDFGGGEDSFDLDDQEEGFRASSLGERCRLSPKNDGKANDALASEGDARDMPNGGGAAAALDGPNMDLKVAELSSAPNQIAMYQKERRSR